MRFCQHSAFFDAVLLVKRKLGAIKELSVGVNVSTFDEWMHDQWKLYGSSDRLLSNTLRKVFSADSGWNAC